MLIVYPIEPNESFTLWNLEGLRQTMH